MNWESASAREVGERRMAFVAVPLSVVAAMVTGRSLEVDGLPDDARYVRAFPDMMRDALCFVFTHPSFEPVLVGEQMPALRGLRISAPPAAGGGK